MRVTTPVGPIKSLQKGRTRGVTSSSDVPPSVWPASCHNHSSDYINRYYYIISTQLGEPHHAVFGGGHVVDRARYLIELGVPQLRVPLEDLY